MVGTQQTRVKCCQLIRHAYLVCRALSAQCNHFRPSATTAAHSDHGCTGPIKTLTLIDQVSYKWVDNRVVCETGNSLCQWQLFTRKSLFTRFGHACENSPYITSAKSKSTRERPCSKQKYVQNLTSTKGEYGGGGWGSFQTMWEKKSIKKYVILWQDAVRLFYRTI